MEKYNFEKILSTMKQVALKNGAVLAKSISGPKAYHEKGYFKNLVTDTDIELQGRILDELGKKYPEARFIAEEMDNSEEDLFAELVFIVDPLDGTINFVRSIQYSCISIACFSFGKPVAGVVYNPYANELFSALKGGGAYLNDDAIQVSDLDIAETVVLYGTSPYDPETIDNTFEILKRVFQKCLDLRRFGAAALDICNVACGRAGLYFEERLSLWDYAAAMLIVSEAGGEIYDFTGKKLEPSLKKASFITGSHKVIEQSCIMG